MTKPKYIRALQNVPELEHSASEMLKTVVDKYAFRANDYYLSLINWDDPDDPIRKIVIPDPGELEPWGKLDASNEAENYVAPGVQHKYRTVALLLVNEVCGSYCRFCFRKRLFMDGNDEVVNDIEPGLEYIRKHEEISNILLTGGDPLLLSTGKLDRILTALREIPHVRVIRIGTKMPAFNPYRILNDPDLLESIRKNSTHKRRIYFMVHFNHPRELTDVARRGLRMLTDAGGVLCNQSPILKGINANPAVLAQLCKRLSWAGAPPYYFFQGRPTAGNKPFELPIAETYKVYSRAAARLGGLSRRMRLVMSHESGKIEIVAVTDSQIFLKYHRARNPEDENRFMAFSRDDEAYWFDDLVREQPEVVPSMNYLEP